MATRSPLNELCVPGRLIKDPTSLSGSFPYGGTELGNCRDMAWRPVQKAAAVVSEAWGGIETDHVWLGETCLMMVLFSSWDADALGEVFPGGGAGSSGRARVSSTVNGSARAGSLMSARASKLLFVPDAITVNPAILLYQAVPLVESSALMRLRRNLETGIACGWRAQPDGTGRVFQAGAIGDLTL